MIYLSAALVTLLAVELMFQLPLMELIDKLSATLKKVAWVVSSNSISDHWKEKVLLVYSGQIALITLKITAIIGGVGVAIVVLSLILDMIFWLQKSTVDFLMSWLGISLATVTSITYFLFRRSSVS